MDEAFIGRVSEYLIHFDIELVFFYVCFNDCDHLYFFTLPGYTAARWRK